MDILVILGIVFLICVLLTKGASDYEEQHGAQVKLQEKKEEERNAFLEEEKRKAQEKFEREKKIREALSEEYKDCVEIDFEVKGVFARSKAAKDIVLAMEVGEEVKLRKEPTNPYDRNAVKVIAERHHVGYIPKKASRFVTELIDNKRIVKVFCKYAGDAKVYVWDKSDPFLDITIFYK